MHLRSLALTLVAFASASTPDPAPDPALFDVPNDTCRDAPMTPEEAIRFVGFPADGAADASRIVGPFPMFERARACDADGHCGAWEAPTVVAGPFASAFRAYPVWSAHPPAFSVEFTSSSSERAITCEAVGQGPCEDGGRSVIGVVGRHCVWLMQEEFVPATAGDGDGVRQVRRVVTGSY
jgi:hypothetical protein